MSFELTCTGRQEKRVLNDNFPIRERVISHLYKLPSTGNFVLTVQQLRVTTVIVMLMIMMMMTVIIISIIIVPAAI